MSEQKQEDGSEYGMALLKKWKEDPAVRAKHENYTAFLKFEREEQRLASILAKCPEETRSAVEKRLRKGEGR